MRETTGAGTGDPESRQQILLDYQSRFLRRCPRVQPCRDPALLRRAARYLLGVPEPRGAFTVFPFYRTVTEAAENRDTDCKKHLSAFLKATELLEILCVNLFIQPWRKEIRTLKCFTGPFVYVLQPVFSSSTIQEILACIGYLPHSDPTKNEYRLSVDVDPDRAAVVGFELLLARVKCHQLLELLEQNQLGSKECLDLLKRNEEPLKNDDLKGKAMNRPKEDADKSEESLSSDSGPVVAPQARSRGSDLHLSNDPSFVEMQKNYPDLQIRGRPLLQDKPHKLKTSRASARKASTYLTSAKEINVDSGVAQPPDGRTIFHKNDVAKPCRVTDDDGRSGDRACCETAREANTTDSFENRDGSLVDQESEGPKNFSLCITLRVGSGAEPSLCQRMDEERED